MNLYIFVMFLLFDIRIRHVWGNSETSVLMEMKSALDPDGRLLYSWTQEGDPCGGVWFDGVACNAEGKVTNISLQGMGLSGGISPAVAGLKFLSGLFLHYNLLIGEIPLQISYLAQLVDLYLNVNHLSGSIPPEIGEMGKLQVLQLSYNELNGTIPAQIGSLTNLSVLSLQHNHLTGEIPRSLADMVMLSRLNLSSNSLVGSIPPMLAYTPELKTLDLQFNNLSGFVSPALKRLKEGFRYGNNFGLCGISFPSLKNCSKWNGSGISLPGMNLVGGNNTQDVHFPEPAIITGKFNTTSPPYSSRFPKLAAIAGSTVLVAAFTAMTVFIILQYRRRKQKIEMVLKTPKAGLIIDRMKDHGSKTPSPLTGMEYPKGWSPHYDDQNCIRFSEEFLENHRFNLDEVESATQCFSEANLLGKRKFSSVYRGMLRDGSLVAIRRLSVASCRSEDAEFSDGMRLLTSLRHENLVRIRGFCCSRGRGECFLIHDFAPNGRLSDYLQEEGPVLEWTIRVSIIQGLAKGLEYLHSSMENKPAMVHQNISAEKVLLDHNFNPLIMDSGLPKLVANDVVFSALKESAAMGYLAPEYVTTGRFTQKSDIYAFGVILLQLLSGTQMLSGSVRAAAESRTLADVIDPKLKSDFSEEMGLRITILAVACTHEIPNERPSMFQVVHDLHF